MFGNTIYLSLSLVAAVLATPITNNLHRRAVVAHDSLNPIAQRVQSGTSGDLIVKFNPALHIASGCEVYTAVDDEGNTR